MDRLNIPSDDCGHRLLKYVRPQKPMSRSAPTQIGADKLRSGPLRTHTGCAKLEDSSSIPFNDFS